MIEEGPIMHSTRALSKGKVTFTSQCRQVDSCHVREIGGQQVRKSWSNILNQSYSLFLQTLFVPASNLFCYNLMFIFLNSFWGWNFWLLAVQDVVHRKRTFLNFLTIFFQARNFLWKIVAYLHTSIKFFYFRNTCKFK